MDRWPRTEGCHMAVRGRMDKGRRPGDIFTSGSQRERERGRGDRERGGSRRGRRAGGRRVAPVMELTGEGESRAEGGSA